MAVSPMTGLSLRITAVLAAFLVMPASVLAQDDGPELLDLRFVTVAAGQNAEWLSLLGATREERQKEGQAYFHVFERVRGPLGVYLIITPYMPVGAPMTEQAEINWLNRFQHTIASQSLVTAMHYPDASTSGSAWAHPSGPYMLYREFSVAGGQSSNYRDWLAQELTPAYRDAGADDARALRAFVGYSPRTWLHLAFIDSWPGGRLGLDRKMLNKGDAMVASQQYHLYAFRGDLSYTAN